MRIGIYGGSFNPPHLGHRDLALKLLFKNCIDKVIYVPVGDSYLKKDLIAFAYRFQMLKILFINNNNIDVSDYEAGGNLVYTYQTLDYFKERYKNDEIYFICGSDNLKNLNYWKNYEYIIKNYRLLVVLRDKDIFENILNDNIIITDLMVTNISSTLIRNKLKQGEGCSDYLDESVYNYIKENNLYT